MVALSLWIHLPLPHWWWCLLANLCNHISHPHRILIPAYLHWVSLLEFIEWGGILEKGIGVNLIYFVDAGVVYKNVALMFAHYLNHRGGLCTLPQR